MSVKEAHIDSGAFAEQATLTSVIGTHPKAKILAVLLSEGRDISINDIAEQAGMSRSTVYDYIDDLIDFGVVVQTRKVGKSPLYEINRNSEAAKNLARFERALIHKQAESLENSE